MNLSYNNINLSDSHLPNVQMPNSNNSHATKSQQSFISRNKAMTEKTPSKDSLNITMGNLKFKRQNRSNSKSNYLNSSSKENKEYKDIENLNIKIDEKCMSCNGGKGMLTQAFKLACIN